MREVKAFVRSTKVSEVIKALRHNGFKSMTVTEVEGTGRFTKPGASPSLKFPITHSKMAKLELLCKKEDVETIVKLIYEFGGTGEKGDGIISISQVERVFKVRTGEESQEE
ncbi:P-II family nitrogen regulator [Pontibacter actiniarum]|uniref:Transcriptional regulator n=1 Tax=Pontibacter actiniarum TaxID=323450 RepID=A0A1X9YZE6_9BACT|nr:P-II family nitrogen regulator [Pontibacter actiniarum]ARS38094.1 transcriptional regulator [Pontibacter actiniarum]